MSKQRIRLIVVLMSLALVGLASFQVYWIAQTARANQRRFETDVHRALVNVAGHLEKQDMVKVTRRAMQAREIEAYSRQIQRVKEQIAYNHYVNQRKSKLDSMGRATHMAMNFSMEGPNVKIQVQQSTTNGMARTYTRTADTTFFVPNKEFEVKGATKPLRPAAEGRTPDGQSQEGRNPEQTVVVEGARVAARTLEEELDRHEEVLKHKMQVFQIVVDELYLTPEPPLHRIHAQQLDTLMHQALRDHGITTGFEYGIYSPHEDSIYLVSQQAQVPHLHQSAYKASLFSGNAAGAGGLLSVYFPNQQAFLLKQIWGTLSLSLIFMGIVVYCFVYAIRTIIRQKKVSEIKNDFINNMTHEFKTPISTISLACEALRDPELTKDQQFTQRYLGIINDENKRLSQQVEKVLQMATLNRKEYKLKKVPIEVHSLIEKVAQGMEVVATKQGGQLSLQLEASQTNLLADEVHLGNMIYNLLDNALKYSFTAPEVSIRTYNTAEGLHISIADKGIGMRKEEQARIFDKFYRVPTGNRHDVKGFGLGLAYVKAMAEAHEGHIQVSSEPKKGSTFTLTLPLAAV